jgi:acyl-CoA synthetase (AMP-forming)/AMP-acid ligase II
MTEILPVAAVDAIDKLAWVDGGGRGDLVGAPLPGVSVRLDGDGQLHAAGPNLAAGYLGRPPADPPEQATGDLALIDGDGRIVLLGRAKDMLIRGRFNLYPGLYEPAVANLPGVAEAAFVGLPDEVTGDEQVVLALVPAPGTDPATLPGLVRERLAGLIDAAALPDRVVTVAGLPTAGRSAKLDRAALARSLRPGAEGRP